VAKSVSSNAPPPPPNAAAAAAAAAIAREQAGGRMRANSIRIPPQSVRSAATQNEAERRGFCRLYGAGVCVCVCVWVGARVHNSRPAPDVKGRTATLQSDKTSLDRRRLQRYVTPNATCCPSLSSKRRNAAETKRN